MIENFLASSLCLTALSLLEYANFLSFASYSDLSWGRTFASWVYSYTLNQCTRSLFAKAPSEPLHSLFLVASDFVYWEFSMSMSSTNANFLSWSTLLSSSFRNILRCPFLVYSAIKAPSTSSSIIFLPWYSSKGVLTAFFRSNWTCSSSCLCRFSLI